MNKKSENLIDLKNRNRFSVLREIRAGASSRAELARRTGLSRQSVSVIIAGLISQGMVRENGTEKSNGGRKATSLALVGDCRYSIGIAVDRQTVKIGLYNMADEKIDGAEYRLGDYRTADRLFSDLSRSCTDFCRAGKTVLGIGFCMPGPIRKAEGTAGTPANMEMLWHFPVVDFLQKKTMLPVLFERDTNAYAANEIIPLLQEDFFYILADSGLGGSLIRNGEIYYGKHMEGCEIGHISLDMFGKKCRCGCRGCAELYCSVPSVLQDSPFSAYEALIAAKDTPQGNNCLTKQAEALSVICADVVNLYDVDTVILGGKLATEGNPVIDMISAMMQGKTLRNGNGAVRVLAAQGGNDPTRAGAKAVTRRFFFGGS